MTGSGLRHTVYKWLEPEPDDVGIERFINGSLMALIVLNVIAVVIDTVPDVRARYGAELDLFERFSVAVFTVELLARVWSCTSQPRFAGALAGRARFVREPLIVIDILALLPSYLAMTLPLDARMLRVFRVIRLIRLLRLARYLEALRSIRRVYLAKREQLAVTAMMGFMLLLIASSAMYVIEHPAQPDVFSSIPASMWWGVVTLTTVGYGDSFPITPLGRMLGACIQVIGVGLFALPAGILASGFAEHLDDKAQVKSCPHCGARLDD